MATRARNRSAIDAPLPGAPSGITNDQIKSARLQTDERHNNYDEGDDNSQVHDVELVIRPHRAARFFP